MWHSNYFNIMSDDDSLYSFSFSLFHLIIFAFSVKKNIAKAQEINIYFIEFHSSCYSAPCCGAPCFFLFFLRIILRQARVDLHFFYSFRFPSENRAGEKPYTCAKGFKESFYVKRYLPIHTGEFCCYITLKYLYVVQ